MAASSGWHPKGVPLVFSQGTNVFLEQAVEVKFP